MSTLPIYNSAGKEIDTLKLDERVFDGLVNEAVLYQTVCAYRAAQRKGLASTKTRGEVSGGGRKPWRQKGTGRARVGSIRSPLWRHGGVVFGPHPRDFSFILPRKIRIQALRSALNAKLKENNFIVVDDFKINGPKTKEAAKVLANLNIGRRQKALLLLDKKDEPLQRALRNLEFLSVNLSRYAHAYEILSAQKLIVAKDGLKTLTARIK